MIIQSWLLVGGSELGFLQVARMFAEAGYRVTMVLNRFQYPEAVALRPQLLQYTHDIHFLPTFLRMADYPRYIRHLLESRGIKLVLTSNCQFIYQLLPSLSEQLPDVKFIE